MSDPNATVSSSLPILAFAVPAVAGALVFLGRKLGRLYWQSLAIAGSAAVALAGLLMLPDVVAGRALVSWGEEFRVDGLSALLVLAIGFVGSLTAIYSVRYVAQPGLVSRLGEPAGERRMPVFYGLLLWFIASAKREETRTKRIAIVVRLLARNRTMSDHFYGSDRR